MYYFNKYNHQFGVARTNKKENNFLTTLNYQYIQSNNFTEESIKSLADFTVDWIKKVMTGDKLYTMLFMIGCHDEDKEIYQIENGLNSDIAKALMYDDSILNDSYVRQKICQLIDKKIRQAKIGKLLVEGDYSFLIPDLYALAEHAFGTEVHGLLPAEYSYVKRWVDNGTKVISLQRSPLVAPGENRLRQISYDERCKDWFQYIQSGIVMSIWDLAVISMSDADYDGDIGMNSNNQYLINSIDNSLNPIMYEKKKQKEQRLNPGSFASMDCKAFNQKVGQITNLASTMIGMLCNFSPCSREYKEIRKRIDIMRFYQGNCIDSTKGEEIQPIPSHWFKKQKYISITDEMSEQEKSLALNQNKEISFNNRICGNKKPYFFGYVYPAKMAEQTKHKSNYKRLAERLFDKKLYDVLTSQDKTKEEKEFIKDYYRHMPLMLNNCTMNILSQYVEDVEWDNRWKRSGNPFDYHILMSENYDISDIKLYKKMSKIVGEFFTEYKNAIVEKRQSEISEEISFNQDSINDYNEQIDWIIESYINELLSVCSDESKVVDYLVDILYTKHKSKSKLFLWRGFGSVVLDNIKSKSKTVTYPILDDENGAEYLGKKYSLREVENNVNSIQ